MPAGTDLVIWNPRVGATGNDRYRWPSNIPLYAGTPESFYADPARPTLAEVNASEGWNQMVAEMNRRTPNVDSMQAPAYWHTTEPAPYASASRGPIPVGGRPVWWTGETDMHPAVIARDYNFVSGSDWKDDEFRDVLKPAVPGNSFWGLAIREYWIRDWEKRGNPPNWGPTNLWPDNISIYEGIRKLRQNMAIDHVVLWDLRYHKTRNTFIAGQPSHLSQNPRASIGVSLTDGHVPPPPPYPPSGPPVTYALLGGYAFYIGQWYRTYGGLHGIWLYRGFVPFEIPVGMPTIASANWQNLGYMMRPNEARPLFVEVWDMGSLEDYQEGGTPSSPPPWTWPPGVLMANFDVGAGLPPPTAGTTHHLFSMTNWFPAGTASLSTPGKRTFVVTTHRETQLIAPFFGSPEEYPTFYLTPILTGSPAVLRCYT
jgi:hypothetical protein